MLKKFTKPWGGHHLLPAIPIFAVLYFLPLVGVPLAHAMIWFAKELGEATQRAGGTGKALHDWRQVKNGGPWEPWDWITPGIAGFIIWSIA